MRVYNWRLLKNHFCGDTLADKPEIQDIKSPNYREIYSTGVFGGLTPDDARLTFFLDKVETKTSIEPLFGEQKVSKFIREALVEVHMTPTQWKRIALWMMQNVALYETAFGTIPMEPKQTATLTEPITELKTEQKIDTQGQ